MKISIVSPVYKAEKIVPELVNRIQESLRKITENYEIILVEDGSPDQSWAEIEKVAQSNKQIKGIKLSRNFGQHYAITAGLEEADGDYVILMDCDLQDNPKYIQKLVDKAKEGFDIVYTQKSKRNHSLLKNATASIFNWVYNQLIDDKLGKANSQIGSYSLITKKAQMAYLKINDQRRHYLMILRWLGFNSGIILIEHESRFEGKSSYTFGKLLMHAIDGITSQSDKILRITAVFGFILSVMSFISILTIVGLYMVRPFAPGWPSIAILILLMGGLTIMSIGVCGIYIGKTFEQSKGRPLYIIDKKVNA